MSSQILLSRGVADPDTATSTGLDSPALVTSIYESGTSHFMTLGNAASQSIPGFDGVDADNGTGKTVCSQQPRPAETAPIAKRAFSRSNTFFEDPNDPLAALDDDLLEPCPHVPICDSVSEVLRGKEYTRARARSAMTRSLDMTFRNSRIPPGDTAAAAGDYPPLFPASTFPPDRSTQPNLNIEPWLDSQATNREARLPAASRVPTEILQQIYERLGPVDFNSARHTCRLWFISSLNYQLLSTMLRRIGYSDGVIRNKSNVPSGFRTLSPEWVMSKRLARECALGPDVSRLSENQSALFEVSTVDFTEIEVHYPGPDLASTIFTVSGCGRFLMAANGCVVFIYELNRSQKSGGAAVHPGLLRPITSVVCPRRVLTCSMDTSSQRYAIAILLDGRMGLVCDITILNPSSVPSSPLKSASEEPRHFSHRDSDPTLLYSSTPCNKFSSQDIQCTTGTQQNLDRFPGHSSMPLEEGPRSLYRNLCSEDDPPRSVAICPQRRCVAFGCSSGLELHWVDALTGQDLNRWFPLTAPSDYLFFLPPRKTVDSAKKLRLISSAGRPHERSSMSSRAFGHRARTSPFWERFGWGVGHFDDDEGAGHVPVPVPNSAQGILTRLRIDASRSSLIGRMDCSDHYRAVPLSDGYHILFTDPASGLLCLGSDAPVGGPTKLLRKIWFHCPESTSIIGSSTPVAYAAGSDLTQGVRVCAAFDTGSEQTIWLFSVPTDIFGASQIEKASSTTANWLNASSSRESMIAKPEDEWMKWWPHDGLQQWLSGGSPPDPAPGIPPKSVWPVKIRGQMIGTCKGLVDLAIDSGPHMTVWAFSKSGIATVWKLDDGQTQSTQNILVVRDGTVREVECRESGRDIEMTDAPDPPPLGLREPGQFDGPASIECHHKQPVHYDVDGDVLMADLPAFPRKKRSRAPEQETVEAVILDVHGNEVRYQTETWTRPVYRDLVEELTGIARIDLEIR
ncbi:hypothetical protein ONS95_008195 [Cadophora gregata]|uniref:uncharacterized protein n=1 Tax=Cadophora gregata TaxID=51156 RepID=UPI0026DCF62E|nr:uncharacterized protein ONS95_008195 [Cadophora gregata]KAK0100231.1 hypothetical protein ONS96_007514 [Cadophora gregata f. sp. sojae]KAK0126607.1 hypothetical protein ONS95_008195 [Cadophora gregata]